ncbi:hypothetical protein BD626DRAFT_475341 [Schizophyllum amplum]|uniref:Inhibitor I9 domain-containing protein n=1 Tax=Schizophyllum amplum TaxID=97359 RepID=A0A550CYC2_9AGAR|nr:hypothetical protein BD626DRAFT_475341 [Auriculariopsis ampla]
MLNFARHQWTLLRRAPHLLVHNIHLHSPAPTNPHIMSADKYIVVFKQGVSQEQIKKHADQVNQNGGEVTQVYDTIMNGFSAKISPEHLQSLNSFVGDEIDYIEPDGKVTTQ